MKRPSSLAALAAVAAFALAAPTATATTYWLDNSVAASGDGLTKETAFKTWDEVCTALGSTAGTVKTTVEATINVVESDTPYVASRQLYIGKELTVVGVTASGQPADAAKVVIKSDNTTENPTNHRFVNAEKALHLENVTVRGFANTSSSAEGIGGAVRLGTDGIRLYAKDCVFAGNSATTGGAVCGSTKKTSVELAGCTVEGSEGYAFYDYSSPCQNTFSNCMFVSNENTCYCNRLGNVTNSFVECTFLGNKESWFVPKVATGNATVLRRCLFEANAASGWFISNQDHLEIDACRFFSNTNNTRPMIQLPTGGDIRNCLFADNFIASGANDGSGRSASVIFCTKNGSGRTIANNTFVGNSMPRWCVDQEVDGDAIVNNIVKENVSGTTWSAAKPSVWTNNFLSYSISNGAAQGNIGLSSDADPGFTDAANGDYTLLKTSVCRDAGDNSVWSGVVNAKDLLGKPRINPDEMVGGVAIVDIGCYEWFNTSKPTVLCFR